MLDPSSAPPSRVRVLIVEDSAIIAMDLQRRLQRMGFEVCGTTRRALEAVTRSRESQPDLVLMDYNLRGEMTGLDAARAIRAEGACAILFVTGHANSILNSALSELHASILAKPFDDASLVAAIRSALADRG